MKKRNDILLFVQDRATRENNIKGRISESVQARRNAREKRFGSPGKGRGDIKNDETGIEECL